MARLTGIIRMTGKLDGKSLYVDKRNGDIVRTPGGPSKIQIKTQKSLAPVRKNNAEFARASSGGKLIRHAFKSLIDICKDTTITTRLVSVLQTIIKADTTHRHGNRVITEANLARFKNFNLNIKRKADYYFRLPVTVEKKRKEFTVSVNISMPSKIPSRNATHWKVTSVVAGINFGKEEYKIDEKGTSMKAVKDGDQVITISHDIVPRGFYFHGMCIGFFEERKGNYNVLFKQDLAAGVVGYVGQEL